jgi:hypothetical protein
MLWKTKKGVSRVIGGYASTSTTRERGASMAQNDEETREDKARDLEVNLEMDYEKKDLKAQRELTKQNLYDGSKKLKHTVPKGKRI